MGPEILVKFIFWRRIPYITDMLFEQIDKKELKKEADVKVKYILGFLLNYESSQEVKL